MRILDKYINKNILTTFLFAVTIFTCIYILIDMTAQLDEFLDRKVPIEIIAQYYLSFFPIILVQTSSIACLIAVLITFSSMNNTNEIIAMRASGLNFWQITKSAVFFSILVSIFVFWVNEDMVPKATQLTKKIRNENMILEADRARKKKEKIKNLTFYGLKNRLYFIDTFDPATDELHGITIIEYDNDAKVEQKIVALKGVWTGIAWKFYQCQITSYQSGRVNMPLKLKNYDEKLMDIKETPGDFMKQRINVSSMNIRELKEYINRFSSSGAVRALNNLRVDLHQKIAYPFGNFVIVLLGLPFALRVKSRKGMTFTSVGIAIAIAFFYYICNAVSIALGKGAIIPPIFSAWMAPIIFTCLAICVIEADFSN